MKIPKINISHSFTRRLTLRVLATVVIIYIAILLVICGFSTLFTLAEESLRLDSHINIIEMRINGELNAVETIIRNNTADVSENLDKPEYMYELTHDIVRLNSSVFGSAIAFEPNFFKSEGQYYSPYSYRSSTGAIEEKQLGNESYDYFQMEWYTKAKESGKPCWSEPYFDEGGGNMAMVTCSYPIKDKNDKLFAVITADVMLDLLTKMVDIKRIQEDYENAYFYIISGKGNIISHPNKDWVLHRNMLDVAKETKSSRDDKFVQDMMEGKDKWTIYREDNGYKMVCFAPLNGVSDWSMAIVCPLEEVLAPALAFHFIILIIMVVGLILLFVFTHDNIKAVARPLVNFAQSADEIAKGNLQAKLPIITSNDEMHQLLDSFKAMQKSLVKQIEETKQVNEQKGRIESELIIARDIQMSMIPKTFPPFPERNDINVFACLSAAKEVGGDLYDYYIRDEKLFFCIGDVSGKGIPASLFMAVTRALFRTVSAHESIPGLILTDINEVIAKDNDSMMFVTLFVGVLDIPTGRLHYSNGGHNAPILLSSNGIRNGELPVDPNYPIGIVPNHRFSSQETLIDPYTTIFLYTDGVTEAEDTSYRLFGEERIFKTFEQVYSDQGYDPETLIKAITNNVKDYVGDAEQSDDMTMLSIQYMKKQLDVRFQRSICLPNDIEKIPELAGFVDEVCEGVGLDMSLTMSINLAMEEAVVNAMSYAYPTGQKGNINIEAQANDERLKFIISDSGKPFDPTAKKDVDVSLSAEDRPIGGLGIHLVRQIMDSINYERIDGKNILTLRKKLVTLLVFILCHLSFTNAVAQDKFIFTPQWSAQAQFAGYYVAQEKGFYKQAGLNVEIVHPSVSQSAIRRVSQNESHATTLQLAQAMDIIDYGTPLVNILQTSMNNALVIVSRRNKNPLQQKGEKVGIWSAGFGQIAICMSMKEGLNYEWIPFASNTNLFLSGAIDATLAMSYNEYYQLLQAGITLTKDNVYRFSEHGYNVQEDGVYMIRSYYETHRDQARRFAAASKKGWEWAAAHPDEALDIVMRYVQRDHIATNRVMQKLMLDEVLRLQIDRESKKREFRLRPDMVRFASRLMFENNMLSREITYEELTGK